MEIETRGSVKILKLIERVDSLTSREVDVALDGIISQGALKVVCDCCDTKYVSSAGLRVFLMATKRLQKSGGQLVIVCPRTSYAYEVLETAGFTAIIGVCDTVDAAVQRLG